LRANDPKNSIAQNLLYDLAEALLCGSHPASVDVPDNEYVRALQDAFDIIQADANTERNYGSLCRIGSVLVKLKDVHAKADEPDLFWNCGDIDSGDRGIDHVISVIADGMDLSSTDTFPIMRAKRFPDGEVCITVDAEGDVEWKWAEPEQEESL